MVDIKTTIAFHMTQLYLNRAILGIYMSSGNVNTLTGNKAQKVQKAQPVSNSWWRSW